MSRAFQIELPPPLALEDGEVLDVVLGVTRARDLELNGDSRQFFVDLPSMAMRDRPPLNVLRHGVGPATMAMRTVLVDSEGEPGEFVKYVVRGADL
ncbi:MAG: hypothetical protein R3190_19680, partial [Thermoanaerobaculia bacterium]|nr:hypothetical protein [Thermoanaerobaculia bacterium]